VLHGGHLGEDTIDHFKIPLPYDKKFGAGVLYHIVQFSCFCPEVQRDEDSSDCSRCEIGLHVLAAVDFKHSNAVSLSYS